MENKSKPSGVNGEQRSGRDRRQRDIGPPSGVGERRVSRSRRDLDIGEISFIEWAGHFVRYRSNASRDD